MNYLNKQLFAVTDYFEILTLNIVEQEVLEHATHVTTSLDKNNFLDEQNVDYFQSHYSKLFINNNGELIKTTVFFDYYSAKTFAKKHLNEKIIKLQSETTMLQNTLSQL
jgi:hypothetical protein